MVQIFFWQFTVMTFKLLRRIADHWLSIFFIDLEKIRVKNRSLYFYMYLEIHRPNRLCFVDHTLYSNLSGPYKLIKIRSRISGLGVIFRSHTHKNWRLILTVLNYYTSTMSMPNVTFVRREFVITARSKLVPI